MSKQNKVPLAEHGARQKGKPTVDGKRILNSGDTFISLRFPNKPQTLAIPENCIGIVHDDPTEGISVLWADCQTARRWKNKVATKETN